MLRRHPDIWIFADEIYSRLVYEGEFASIASLPGMYERTIISDGASKTWAMTGWRIGFASNPVLAPQFVRWVTNTDSCASQISQWAAVEALKGPQDEPRKMRASFLARRDLIVGLLNRVPGVTLQDAGRRVLRLAQRHRGLPHDRRHGFRGIAASACSTRPGVAVLADIHFGARVPGEGQHIRFSYAASNAGDRGRRRAHGGIHPPQHGRPREARSAHDLEAQRDGRRGDRARRPIPPGRGRGGRGAIVLQPARRPLERDETLVQACAREVLEESAWHCFEPHAAGRHLPLEQAAAATGVTYLRFAFCGEARRARGRARARYGHPARGLADA